jgi:hypothetical protein
MRNLNAKLSIYQYDFFILEVVKAWIASSEKHPQTMYHLDNGVFMVTGKTIKLASNMK